MSIRVEQITKKYGQQLALHSVSFEVKAGEIVGFLGPNGAGKSTLMKIITGYLQPDSGSASINGLKVEPNRTDFKSKIGYLPEQNPLYPEMYIKEYLKLIAGFHKLKHVKERIDEAIEMTGLNSEVSKKIGALSKGFRQRVGLAQALIHDPQVLILDEPTTGLDPNQLEEIRNLITNISRNKTVMLSTHIMQEVEAICNRIIIINKGEIVADDIPSNIKKMAKGIGQQILFSTQNKLTTKVLLQLPYIATVVETTSNEFLITGLSEEDIRPKLFQTAIEQGWIILLLSEKKRSFENIFKELTK